MGSTVQKNRSSHVQPPLIYIMFRKEVSSCRS
nr:MAG TPA: hypothetical protein [Caudoviricetes sp.]